MCIQITHFLRAHTLDPLGFKAQLTTRLRAFWKINFHAAIECGTCGGAGNVRAQQGFFSIQQTCPTCHGTGRMIPNPCTACDGVGRTKRTKTLEVKIPAGIDDGMRIRSSGNGEPGVNGGPAGDLYVEIHVREHPVFQRDGDDLHVVVPVRTTMAALGGRLKVPTLDGSVEIDLPEGTQPGRK
ncbi:MAG: hypothetical protein EBX70_07325, partial [Betaproteobacteria bacterium]|nr:hypothetical protein [Betaproteobacteria bacterium]